MSNLPVQMDLFKMAEDLEDNIFELYEKTQSREFKSHVRFIKADSLREAEDLIADIDPDYWRTRSVRNVNIDYAWKVFEQLHFSYHMCKSTLGLESIAGD